MSHTPNLFPLKLLVISLGLVLAGGIVFVLITIGAKAHEEIKAAHCADATVHLGSLESLTGVAPMGSTVQLTICSAEQSKVLTVDRCTGAILQTLTIAP